MRRTSAWWAMGLAVWWVLVARSVPAHAAGLPDSEVVQGGGNEVVCQEVERADFCSRLCAPAQMIFLPCMAVGSPAMAACREREIKACLVACEKRPGPPGPDAC